MMIEATVRTYLQTALSVPVYLEIPADPPTEFIVFQTSGESKRDHLPKATFQFDSYSTTNQKASALDDRLIAALEKMGEEVDSIRGVEQTSGSMRNDTATKKYRHSTLFEIRYY